MLSALWSVLLQLAPWMLLGMVIAGVLHSVLPAGSIRRHLGGRHAVLKSVLWGVPLPLCSCGVIPTGLGLRRDGASRGASIGFLISTPQTGVDSLLVSAAFLGWPFAVFKLVSAAVTGLVGGWLADRVGSRAQGEPPVPRDVLAAQKATGGRWRDGAAHALDLLRSVWGWLAVGVFVSAALSVWVPPTAFAESSLLGGQWALVTVLLVSVPLYVCATASIPIAAALVAGGMPAGAALVFLMAGPATNVATIGAIYRGFGGRVLGVYLGTIMGGSIALGWAFHFLLPVGAVGSLTSHAHAHAAWWETLSALGLVGLVVWFAAEALRARLRRSPGALPTADEHVAACAVHTVVELPVAGMTCGGCVRKLDSALRRLEGVREVEVSLDPGCAVVRGDVDVARVREVVHGVGFRTDSSGDGGVVRDASTLR